MIKGKQIATIKCWNCGLEAKYSTLRVNQPIDIYCKFTDQFNVGELVEVNNG
jgi:transcription elongation factor Elf1